MKCIKTRNKSNFQGYSALLASKDISHPLITVDNRFLREHCCNKFISCLGWSCGFFAWCAAVAECCSSKQVESKLQTYNMFLTQPLKHCYNFLRNIFNTKSSRIILTFYLVLKFCRRLAILGSKHTERKK